MSAIDTKNAEKIREPMQVIVTLSSESTENVTLQLPPQTTFELADYATLDDNYPMRQLADLQDNGFPLTAPARFTRPASRRPRRTASSACGARQGSRPA